MNKELFNGLTQEQMEKAAACKNNSELLALAKAEGIELSDEQLQAVAGGGCTIISIPKCPYCGSVWILQDGGKWKCLSCDKKFRKPK
jgi:hypothetical protein